MRLGEWMRAAGSGVPWMLLALVANPRRPSSARFIRGAIPSRRSKFD